MKLNNFPSLVQFHYIPSFLLPFAEALFRLLLCVCDLQLYFVENLQASY